MALRSGSGGGFNKPLTVGTHSSTTGIAPHSGLSRNMGGGFMASAPHLSQGGTSVHGTDMIAKYRPAAAVSGNPLGLGPAAGAGLTSQPDANALPTPASGSLSKPVLR